MRIQMPVTNYLPLTGGTMSGNLDMGENAVLFTLGSIRAPAGNPFLVRQRDLVSLKQTVSGGFTPEGATLPDLTSCPTLADVMCLSLGLG